MNRLQKENLEKCFSLLREYIDPESMNKNRENAVLALDQLQKITAGVNFRGEIDDNISVSVLDNGCHGRPLADRSPIGG